MPIYVPDTGGATLTDLIGLVNSELENHTAFGSWQAVGDGTTTSFTVAPLARYIVDDSAWVVEVGGVATEAFTMDFDSGVIAFTTAADETVPLTAKFNHAYWTDELVAQAVNAGINNLFPAFYVPKADTSVSLVANTYEYAMPAATQFITAVETRADATGAYTKMARTKYEWLSDGDHLNLRFFSAPTGFMRVRCINRPSPLVFPADSLGGTAGLPLRAKDPIISYACWYLLTQKIAPRIRSDIAVNTQGVGTLSPRQIADGTQAWLMRYQLQVAANRMPPWMSR